MVQIKAKSIIHGCRLAAHMGIKKAPPAAVQYGEEGAVLTFDHALKRKVRYTVSNGRIH